MAYVESRPFAALAFLSIIVLGRLTDLLYQLYKVLIISSLEVMLTLRVTRQAGEASAAGMK